MTPLIKSAKTRKGRRLFRVFLLILCGASSFAALILPLASRAESLPLQVGDVASSDIISPRSESYESKVLTVKAREEAANSIALKYLPADPSINRSQLEKLHKSINFITSVRNDKYASESQKTDDLTQMAELPITPEQAVQLIYLPEDRWLIIQDETLSVLEQMMRKNIRDYQIQENINSLPGLINYSLSTNESEIVQFIVAPFIVPNSLYSESETAKARQQAADQVMPVVKTYAENQAIVVRGQIITSEQYEALTHFNLIRPERLVEDYISSFTIVLVLSLFIVLYFSHRKNTSLSDIRSLTVIAFCFLIFLFTAKVIIPNRTIMPYFFPLPAFALILASFFNLELSIVFPLVLSILVTYGITDSVELTVFYTITSLIGSIVLGKGKNFVSFMRAAVSIAASGILVVTAYRLTNPLTDMFGLLTLYGAITLNGFASASLALLLQFLLSQLLGLPTPINLTELSRSDQPLLRLILQSAPGTYQHSLQVANLGEQAALSIGADALLTKVGAFYHDAGKSMNPSFFIENQLPGNIDSHDDMDPIITAQTIIAHVNDGVTLAEKYHLPPRLQDFIREHHGTQLTRYQYSRAVEQQKDDPSMVDAELFRYPGPKPQSKETGILMLADICEARTRSTPPKNDEELQALLRNVFEYIIKDGSLEDTNLTLRDLKSIQNSFQNTLMNTYHPRIQYPDDRIPASVK